MKMQCHTDSITMVISFLADSNDSRSNEDSDSDEYDESDKDNHSDEDDNDYEGQ